MQPTTGSYHITGCIYYIAGCIHPLCQQGRGVTNLATVAVNHKERWRATLKISADSYHNLFHSLRPRKNCYTSWWEAIYHQITVVSNLRAELIFLFLRGRGQFLPQDWPPSPFSSWHTSDASTASVWRSCSLYLLPECNLCRPFTATDGVLLLFRWCSASRDVTLLSALTTVFRSHKYCKAH